MLHHWSLEQLQSAGVNGGNLGAGDWFQATQDPFGYQKFALARCQFETKITKESSKNTWSLAAVHKFAYTNKSKCVSKCVCLLPFGYIATGVFQHMGEFAQDGDFVVWSLDIADCINVGLKTSANYANWIRLLIFLTLKSGGILKLPARCLYSEWKTI